MQRMRKLANYADPHRHILSDALVQVPCCFCLPVSEQILGFCVQDYDEAETERGYDSKKKIKKNNRIMHI